MKASSLLRNCFVLLAACTVAACHQPIFAQSAVTPATEWHEVSIKNIEPHLMAYWLDPQHHQMPKDFHTSKEIYGYAPLPKVPESSATVKTIANTSKISSLNLGPDMTKVLLVPDDAQHVLWIKATPKEFKAIQQKITFLDRPIRVIKFDVKLMQLRSTELLADKTPSPFNLLFAPTKSLGFGSYSEQLQTIVNDLIAQDKLAVLKDQQFSIRNNLTESISQSNFLPATVDVQTADKNTGNISIKNDTENQLLLEKRFGMAFTPTINNDDSITVFTTLFAAAMLTHQQPSTSDDRLWIKNLSEKAPRTSVFTIRKGDTVVMSGMNSTELGLDNKNLPIIMLLKADIVD